MSSGWRIKPGVGNGHSGRDVVSRAEDTLSLPSFSSSALPLLSSLFPLFVLPLPNNGTDTNRIIDPFWADLFISLPLFLSSSSSISPFFFLNKGTQSSVFSSFFSALLSFRSDSHSLENVRLSATPVPLSRLLDLLSLYRPHPTPLH